MNTLDTAHMTTLTTSSVRSGFAPSPRRATMRPPTMNPVLSSPNSSPHTSTETSESPYASSRAMNTPPRKLLIVEKAIRPNRPGMAATTAIVPRRSSRCAPEPSSAAAGRSSGMRTTARCAITTIVAATATSSTCSIPDSPTSSPLITEVTRNDAPFVVPTRPFARSRPSGGTSMVTAVDSVMARRLPTITPAISSSTSAQSAGLAGSVKLAGSVNRYTVSATA